MLNSQHADCFRLRVSYTIINSSSLNFIIDLMMRMGFSADEIKDSLLTNKYDEVMATYLLLDEKRVSTFTSL